MAETGSFLNFSLANPRNEGAGDLPKLLRRLADEIDTRGIGPTEILDLTVSSQMAAEGPWLSVTLYWSPDDPASVDSSLIGRGGG